MTEYELNNDRQINSTQTNEFATGLRDETMIEEDMINSINDFVPEDDEIADAVSETREKPRLVYEDMGIDPDI